MTNLSHNPKNIKIYKMNYKNSRIHITLGKPADNLNCVYGNSNYRIINEKELGNFYRKCIC